MTWSRDGVPVFGNPLNLSNAFNFVTLGPHRFLMKVNNQQYRKLSESLGIECFTLRDDETTAGGIVCLTRVLARMRAATHVAGDV